MALRLGVFVLQPEKFERERMPDFFVGTHRTTRLRFRALGQHRRLVTRERRALVKLAVHLPLQLPHRPPAAHRLGVIKRQSLRRTCPANQQPVVRPGQRKCPRHVA